MRLAGPLIAFSILAFTCGCPLSDSIVWLNDPLDAEEHVRLGAIYEKDGKLDLAQEQYMLALNKDRGQALAWAGLGNIRMARGRPQRAIKDYRRALKLEPDSPDILNNLAAAYLGVGKLGNAEDAVERAISLDGDNLCYYLDTRAELKLEMDDIEGARIDFCRALASAPGSDGAFREEVIQSLERIGGICEQDGK